MPARRTPMTKNISALTARTQFGQIMERARTKGERFGVVDLLIAALAEENGAAIWSLDSDFRRLSRLGLGAAPRAYKYLNAYTIRCLGA